MTSPEQEGYVAILGVGTWGGDMRCRDLSIGRTKAGEEATVGMDLASPACWGRGARRPGFGLTGL